MQARKRFLIMLLSVMITSGYHSIDASDASLSVEQVTSLLTLLQQVDAQKQAVASPTTQTVGYKLTNAAVAAVPAGQTPITVAQLYSFTISPVFSNGQFCELQIPAAKLSSVNSFLQAGTNVKFAYVTKGKTLRYAFVDVATKTDIVSGQFTQLKDVQNKSIRSSATLSHANFVYQSAKNVQSQGFYNVVASTLPAAIMINAQVNAAVTNNSNVFNPGSVVSVPGVTVAPYGTETIQQSVMQSVTAGSVINPSQAVGSPQALNFMTVGLQSANGGGYLVWTFNFAQITNITQEMLQQQGVYLRIFQIPNASNPLLSEVRLELVGAQDAMVYVQSKCKIPANFTHANVGFNMTNSSVVPQGNQKAYNNLPIDGSVLFIKADVATPAASSATTAVSVFDENNVQVGLGVSVAPYNNNVITESTMQAVSAAKPFTLANNGNAVGSPQELNVMTVSLQAANQAYLVFIFDMPQIPNITSEMLQSTGVYLEIQKIPASANQISSAVKVLLCDTSGNLLTYGACNIPSDFVLADIGFNMQNSSLTPGNNQAAFNNFALNGNVLLIKSNLSSVSATAPSAPTTTSSTTLSASAFEPANVVAPAGVTVAPWNQEVITPGVMKYIKIGSSNGVIAVANKTQPAGSPRALNSMTVSLLNANGGYLVWTFDFSQISAVTQSMLQNQGIYLAISQYPNWQGTPAYVLVQLLSTQAPNEVLLTSKCTINAQFTTAYVGFNMSNSSAIMVGNQSNYNKLPLDGSVLLVKSDLNVSTPTSSSQSVFNIDNISADKGVTIKPYSNNVITESVMQATPEDQTIANNGVAVGSLSALNFITVSLETPDSQYLVFTFTIQNIANLTQAMLQNQGVYLQVQKIPDPKVPANSQVIVMLTDGQSQIFAAGACAIASDFTQAEIGFNMKNSSVAPVGNQSAYNGFPLNGQSLLVKSYVPAPQAQADESSWSSTNDPFGNSAWSGE